MSGCSVPVDFWKKGFYATYTPAMLGCNSKKAEFIDGRVWLATDEPHRRYHIGLVSEKDMQHAL